MTSRRSKTITPSFLEAACGESSGIPLRNLLKRSEKWVPIEPDQVYKEITVRLWGKGVELRREVLGAEIKSERRIRVKSGQFILSRIDARNGAFGLIPDSLDGGVVSNDFPIYD